MQCAIVTILLSEGTKRRQEVKEVETNQTSHARS
jgi:hypothetical protein